MSKAEFEKAREEAGRQEEEFKKRMNEKYPITEPVRKLVWRMAWDEGHAHGFALVEYYYSLLYEVVEEVRKGFKE